MTQEEKYKRSIEEANKIKRIIESNIYQEEKDNINNELKTIKEQINALKNSNKVNLIDIQLNRNNLLKINNELDKYSKETTPTPEMQNEIETLNNQKKQINEWFNNQELIKNNANDQLLILLNNQEDTQKRLLQIDEIINKFNKNNPTIDEPINPMNTLESLENLETNYNTEAFNEEEYNTLKEKFKEEQELVDSIIETIENNTQFRNNIYEETIQNADSIKTTANKNELRNINKEIKDIERECNILNQTLEFAKTLKIEHNFIDEKENEEEIETKPEDQPLSLNDIYNNEVQITEPIEETNNIEIVPEIQEVTEEDTNTSDVTPETEEETNNSETIPEIQEIPHEDTNELETIPEVQEEPTNESEEIQENGFEENNNEIDLNEINKTKDLEEYEKRFLYVKVKAAKPTSLTSEELNTLIENMNYIMSGDIIVEGDIEFTLNNFIKEITDETELDEKPDIESLKIDITNNSEAREKIKNTNTNVTRISDAIDSNLIQSEDGINELNELSNKEQDEINTIIDKYNDIKENIESIINESNKRDELTKLALGKINSIEEMKLLKEEDLNTVSKISKEDYISLIVKLVNKMQYEKTINKINKKMQDLDNSESKTK